MFDQCAFYLEWPDTVAGTLDNIIVSSHKPEVAVRIPHEYIMWTIAALSQDFLCHFRILIISHKQAGRIGFVQVLHNENTLFTVSC